jgi:hypothetical protein
MISDTYASTPAIGDGVDLLLRAPGLPDVVPVLATVSLLDRRTNTVVSTPLLTYAARFYPNLRGRALPSGLHPDALRDLVTSPTVSAYRVMREATARLFKASHAVTGDSTAWALLITSPSSAVPHNPASLAAAASSAIPGVRTARYAQPTPATLHMPKSKFDALSGIMSNAVWEDLLMMALRSGEDQYFGDVVSVRLG